MADSVRLGESRYGKENVRILRVVRDSQRHEVHELKAQILLEGDFGDSYLTGNNAKIVATETQKNTLYVLSKKYALDNIEEWAVNVSRDFMGRYSHISAVNMEIDEYPWERILVNGKEHNHAFRKGSTGIRFAHSRVTRSGSISITSGFRELQVMKTTQSGFEGYIKDEFTTLQDTRDRVMCTKVLCSWSYSNHSNNKDVTLRNLPSSAKFSYSQLYNEIQKIVLETFAGEPVHGTYSPSVQQTIYDIGALVLKKFPEVEKVSFVLPNIHYYFVDFNQFKTPLKNNKEVFFTFDGAAGHIEGTIERNNGQTPKPKL